MLTACLWLSLKQSHNQILQYIPTTFLSNINEVTLITNRSQGQNKQEIAYHGAKSVYTIVFSKSNVMSKLIFHKFYYAKIDNTLRFQNCSKYVRKKFPISFICIKSKLSHQSSNNKTTDAYIENNQIASNSFEMCVCVHFKSKAFKKGNLCKQIIPYNFILFLYE